MTDFAVLGSITDIVQGDTWDSERLAREVGRRLSVLESLGVGPNCYVLIEHGGTPAFFADLFAVWQLGGCAVCLDPRLTGAELRNIVDFVSPTLLLVDDGFSGIEGLRIPVLCTACEKGTPVSIPSLQFGGHLDTAALILFTSGTTGTPKGVVHSFRSLLARISLNRLYIGDSTLTTTLCVLPTHFGHGLIGNCLTPLYAGKHLVLAPVTNVRTAAALGTIIDTYNITFMSSVPTSWKLVLKVGKPPSGESLLQVSVGSAPLSGKLWHDIIGWSGTKNVVNMYGITETANWLAGASGEKYPQMDGLIGTMWGGYAAVLDEESNLHGQGEGELIVQTPSLMLGYHRRPDLTQEVLHNGWFRTGDVGRIDGDGTMWLTGRKKNEINRAGIKVHPEDIDSLLERHPEVLEACAFGIPDEISGESVGVAIRLAEGARNDPQTLRAWCLERLRRESVPDRWFIVEEIPKTDRGKVNRPQIREYCLNLDGLK